MSFALSNGISLYTEATGTGEPIIFIHEFAGDYRDWEFQVRRLSRSYKCITFNARGYPPSDVPEDVEQYSQQIAVEDIAAVLRYQGVERAHVVGLSMGGYAALNFGISHPEMLLSIAICGAGHGSDPARRPQFLDDSKAMVTKMLSDGMEAVGKTYLSGPTRRRFAEKDARGAAEFADRFASHSALGAALTTRGCQLRRKTIYDLAAGMADIKVPVLIVAGDDDDPCLDPALFMKRNIPDARLAIFPRTTHSVNLEEPELFNRVLLDFLASVGSNGEAR